MKTILSLLVLATFALAQEIQQVPAEQAHKIALKVIDTLGTPADAPFAVEPDADKPVGLKGGGDTGLLAMPDKKLTPEKLSAAGKDASPLGHLWMRNVVPSVKNSAPDPATLRTVTVRDKDNEAKVELYYLGVTKTDAGALELGLYAKDKIPLVNVPLVKTDAAASTTPIEVAGHKEGENTGVLVITVFGSYKADVTVTKPRE